MECKLNSIFYICYEIMLLVVKMFDANGCIDIYYGDKTINLVLVLFPLLIVICVAIYSLIRCYLHFKAYPENLTKDLLCRLISATKIVSCNNSLHL